MNSRPEINSSQISSDNTETLEQLSSVRRMLHEELAAIEFEDKNRDSTINSISLIIRTLERVDNLARLLLNEQKDTADSVSKEEYEELKTKVKTLIRRAAHREKEETKSSS